MSVTGSGPVLTAPGHLLWGGSLLWLLVTSCSAPENHNRSSVMPQATIEDSAEVGMKVLRAKVLGQQLSAACELRALSDRTTFGGEIEIELRIPNPFGRDFQLREPSQGFLVQVDLRMERWMAFGASEILRQRQVAVLDRGIALGVGEELVQTLHFPVAPAGPKESVRRVAIDATLRCDGLEIDGEAYPVDSIDFAATQYLVLPGNWEPLATNPLAALERLIRLPQPDLDRHVLVAAALLPRNRRVDAVQILITGLDQAPSLRRMDTLMAALRFLSGRDFGENPTLWKEWWADRTMGGRE